MNDTEAKTDPETPPAEERGEPSAPVHKFTLILSPSMEITDDVTDALYEAGCDDGTIIRRDGQLFVEFDREAPTFADAVSSAVRDIESTAMGFRVVRIEPDELVSASDIADRIGQTREAVRLHANGRRGPGGFPSPVGGLMRRTSLYRWSEVSAWYAAHGIAGRTMGDEARSAKEVGAANAVLDVRRYLAGDGREAVEGLSDFLRSFVEGLREADRKTLRKLFAGAKAAKAK